MRLHRKLPEGTVRHVRSIAGNLTGVVTTKTRRAVQVERGRPDLEGGLVFIFWRSPMMTLEVALAYARAGFSVLPLQGKRPALPTWLPYQFAPASPSQIRAWHRSGLFHNIGLVCGPVSGNLVVLDLDGWPAYHQFCTRFPALAATYSVVTGSRRGVHLYWKVAHLPTTRRVLGTPWGNFELCALGRQVVAPPSRHPQTGLPYQPYQNLPIQQLDTLDPVLVWLNSLVPHSPRPGRYLPRQDSLNPRLIAALVEVLLARGGRFRGEWLNGPCPFPDHHCHQDGHPSFGFNLRSGYGYCFVCGTLLLKDLCAVFHIDIPVLGGLFAS